MLLNFWNTEFLYHIVSLVDGNITDVNSGKLYCLECSIYTVNIPDVNNGVIASCVLAVVLLLVLLSVYIGIKCYKSYKKKNEWGSKYLISLHMLIFQDSSCAEDCRMWQRNIWD